MKLKTISIFLKHGLVLATGLLFVQLAQAQLTPMRMSIQSTLKVDGLLKNFNELRQGSIPFNPVADDNKLSNPIYPRKVNMRLEGKFDQSYFYNLKIIDALGYRDDKSVSLYLLIPGNEGLIQMINDDLGINASRLKTQGPNSNGGSYSWNYSGYTITLSPNTNVFNESEPAPFYYEVTVRNSVPPEETTEVKMAE